MNFLFIFSILIILYIWIVYPVFVYILSFYAPKKGSDLFNKDEMKKVSVIIAAHNEDKNLYNRINNIYNSIYPSDKIEVIIASDGSTDNTASEVNKIRNVFNNVQYVEINPQGGRANAHNKAVLSATGEILVFTDAETTFDEMFLNNIVDSFRDKSVGFASGLLKYRNIGISSVTDSVGLYWAYELWLRKYESKLGLYIFGTGACCAVRKELYINIPYTGDVDFTTPIDVVLQKFKCRHVEDALAYDVLPDTPEREFKARIRMTAKNIYGTLSRWGISNIFLHPIYTVVLVSHKIARWLTPLFMMSLFLSNLFLLDDGALYVFAFVLQAMYYMLAFLGYKNSFIPFSRQAYNFLLANAAFFIGIIMAIAGKVPKSYTPVNKS